MGGIPEKLKVEYFGNGSKQIYETWWISAHYRYPYPVFFQDFSERGLGNLVAPNFFFDEFDECLGKRDRIDIPR